MSQRALLPRGVDLRDSSNITTPIKKDAKRDPSPGSNPVVRKRGPLVSAACNSCRKRKIKCDGNKPQCSNCSKKNVQCQYDKTLKAERLKLVQDRVKVALDELDDMRQSMSNLAENVTNNENSQAIARAIGNLDSLRSKFDEIEAEIPWRASQTGAQSGSGNLPMEEDDDDEESVPATPWPGQASLPNSLMQRNASISFSIPDRQSSMSSPASRFDSQAFDQSVIAASEILSIHFAGDSTMYYAFRHDLLPLTSHDLDERSTTCSLYQLQCRTYLAQGVTPQTVLGSDVLDLTWVLPAQPIASVSEFTAQVLRHVNTFPGWLNFDGAFRIASVWAIFKVLRWLIYPTLANYENVPEFMKPTPAQLFTPHAFWIALVIRPDLRNEYIVRPSSDHWRQWVYIQSTARINWPNEDIWSMVVLHPATNNFHLTPEFESTISRIENWLFPD